MEDNSCVGPGRSMRGYFVALCRFGCVPWWLDISFLSISLINGSFCPWPRVSSLGLFLPFRGDASIFLAAMYSLLLTSAKFTLLSYSLAHIVDLFFEIRYKLLTQVPWLAYQLAKQIFLSQYTE